VPVEDDRPAAAEVAPPPPAIEPEPPPSSTEPIFETDYEHGLAGWQAIQQPAGPPRITTAAAPGVADDPRRPAVRVMRVELRPGDLTDTGGQLAPRAEVYARAARPLLTPAEEWPDPPGSERWYVFDLFVPAEFPTATDSTWLTLTQWKGHHVGRPPFTLEVKRQNLRIGGKRAGALPSQDLGPLAKGRWTSLVVGMKLSPDPATGWIEVHRDGELRLPRTPLATLQTWWGRTDPVYFKQGLYRSAKWNVTQVLYFSPVRIYDAMPPGLS
jgi:hypothetical protein